MHIDLYQQIALGTATGTNRAFARHADSLSRYPHLREF